VDTVSQVVNDGGKILQGLSNALRPAIRLGVERSFQMLDTVAILKRLSNIFVRRFSVDDMQDVRRMVTQGGDHTCGFLAVSNYLQNIVMT
jgi:hypothetical protein